MVSELAGHPTCAQPALLHLSPLPGPTSLPILSLLMGVSSLSLAAEEG